MFKEKLNKDFIVKFNNFIVEHKLIEKRSKILVGFSGGPDSTALLLALLMIKDSLDLSLLVAHVNYNLRGQDSQADEDFVREFCFSHNLYLVINRVNIESDSNIEATARDIRMNYFYSLLRDYKLDAIALGHNQGDNAETVMMNLIRGAGITGSLIIPGLRFVLFWKRRGLFGEKIKATRRLLSREIKYEIS